ncbi:MAG: penicillin-binding protein 1A [Alphaproteobacteria bacterium]|jgi:penicillin-binding protein 1A
MESKMRLLIKLFLISSVIVSYFGIHYYVKHCIDDLPKYDFFIDPRANVSIKVMDKQGQLIGVRGAYYGGRVDYDTVSEHLIHAIIAIEDRGFLKHGGFDALGILRAMVTNLKAGSVVQGASTLTQQLAKDLFFSAERSYSRKIKELLYAIKLEQNYTKRQIMTLYLNRVYLGAGLYGVAAAAERYFGKSAQDLTIAESAMIAGLLKAPSRYSPTNSFVKAEKRAAIVVGAMYDAGYITNHEKQNALENPAQLVVYSSTGGGGYIADYTADEVSRLIGDYSEDIIVTVSIDMNLQNLSDTLSEFFVNNQGKQYDFSQVAFTAIDDKGQILAMTGGKSYRQSPYNRAVTALRQPGSAFKTFVYAAAFEAGYRPNQTISDGPVNYQGYKPSNYNNKYKGEMTIRSAYIQSINTIAVKLAHQVGIKSVINTAYRAGIEQKLPHFLSLALGATEVSLLELTSAYVPFYNGGYAYKPSIVTEIRNSSGKLLYQYDLDTLKQPVFPSHVLRDIKDISASNVAYGTGRRAQIKNVAVYGKTGTTSNYRDAWFLGHIGLKKGITAGVWIGNDNTKVTKKATGGGVAAVLWHNILENYVYNHKTDLINQALPVKTQPKLIDDKHIKNLIETLSQRQETVTENKPEVKQKPKSVEAIIQKTQEKPKAVKAIIQKTKKKPESIEAIIQKIEKKSPKPIKNVAPKVKNVNIESKEYSEDRIENLLRTLDQ